MGQLLQESEVHWQSSVQAWPAESRAWTGSQQLHPLGPLQPWPQASPAQQRTCGVTPDGLQMPPCAEHEPPVVPPVPEVLVPPTGAQKPPEQLMLLQSQSKAQRLPSAKPVWLVRLQQFGVELPVQLFAPQQTVEALHSEVPWLQPPPVVPPEVPVDEVVPGAPGQIPTSIDWALQAWPLKQATPPLGSHSWAQLPEGKQVSPAAHWVETVQRELSQLGSQPEPVSGPLRKQSPKSAAPPSALSMA
jgi:hypothetical protein